MNHVMRGSSAVLKIKNKCECGSDSVGSPNHSEWCPKAKGDYETIAVSSDISYQSPFVETATHEELDELAESVGMDRSGSQKHELSLCEKYYAKLRGPVKIPTEQDIKDANKSFRDTFPKIKKWVADSEL